MWKRVVKRIVETSHGNELWKLSCENELWKRIVKMISENEPWKRKRVVETNRVNELWKRVVETNGGNELWKRMVETHREKRIMETNHENESWERVVQANRGTQINGIQIKQTMRMKWKWMYPWGVAGPPGNTKETYKNLSFFKWWWGAEGIKMTPLMETKSIFASIFGDIYFCWV